MDEESPNITRREWLATVGGIPLVATINAPTFSASVGTLPDKISFPLPRTYLNGAYTHPISVDVARAAKNYTDLRLMNIKESDEKMGIDRTEARALFAKLINASPEELAFVPSTMMGENIVVNGLSLPGSKSHVVTDALHFDGSLYLYGQLAKQGLNVTVIRPKNNAIDLKDIEAAITPKTKLVALSLVSAINGFQHDLKAVCEIAHARGALVYADIIQAAGAVPIDVRASGVDFCACASYKWLMGDFGVGMLYVRKDKMDLVKRTLYGYRQIESFVSHTLPFEPEGSNAFDFTEKKNAGGHFEVGTFASGAITALRHSLQYVVDIGVDQIQKHRQPMIDRLQYQLPKLGYQRLTPEGSTSPIVAFAYRDAERLLKPKLEAAGIVISVYENRFRISPSVYNDMTDVELLIAALS